MVRRGCASSRTFSASCSTICWTTPASTVAPGTPIIGQAWPRRENGDAGGARPRSRLDGRGLVPRLRAVFRSAESRGAAAGVGLGLAVVERIAAVFGGSIRAESVPGEGSRFVLRLPDATESIGPRVHRARGGNVAGQDMRGVVYDRWRLPVPLFSSIRTSAAFNAASCDDLAASDSGLPERYTCK